MDKEKKDSTAVQLDDTSIKPVSSLRSRFENINSSVAPKPAAKPSPKEHGTSQQLLRHNDTHDLNHTKALSSLPNRIDSPLLISHAEDSVETTQKKKQPPPPPKKRQAGHASEAGPTADVNSTLKEPSNVDEQCLPPIEIKRPKPPPPAKRGTKPIGVKGSGVVTSNGFSHAVGREESVDAPLEEVHESPPPLPLHSKPKFIQSDESLATKSFQSNGTFEDGASETSRRTPSPRKTLTSDHKQKVEQLSSPAIQPKLPPRIQSAVVPSATVTPFRKSPDSTSRPSALLQGFSSAKPTVPSRSPTPNSQTSASRENRKLLVKNIPSPELFKPHESRSVLQPQVDETFLEWKTKQPYRSPPDFPDCKKSNRRPPLFAEGIKSIATGYELRLIDICGEYVCVTGPVTRVWNILTGKLLMSVPHGEGVKVTAVSFRPSRTIANEGMRFWLGNNVGDLVEMDWSEKRVYAKNSAAHFRREIVKIHRHATDLWTIDDEGKLFVWPSDEGSPNLSQGIPSGTLPRGYTTSVAVQNQLWIASGREIRVVEPATAAEQAKHLTAHPLGQPKLKEISCCAFVPAQPKRVYFGHSDGKVSVYSRSDLTCIEVVTLSQNKIYSLAGVGSRLWAGYGNGKILVYDVDSRPWNVSKEWRAHENPVSSIVFHQNSVWQIGRLQIVSLGIDNAVKVWDGMLSEDWLEAEMFAHEEDFTTSQVITASILTWNVGAVTPNELRYDEQDSNFFRELVGNQEPPDIFVVGLQELVDLEDKALTAKSFFKSKKQDSYGHEHLSSAYRAWRDHLSACLERYMPGNEPYMELQSASLVGLFSCVFAKSSLRSRIRNVQSAEVKTGMGGLHGNKGALIVRFTVDDSSICLVNCHLAAGQAKTADRNNDVASILESAPLEPLRLPVSKSESLVCGGDGSLVLDHEICILSGDLNYRIDTMPRDTIISTVRSKKFSKLLERDQLLLSCRKNPMFKLRSFDEALIDFAPTYKYDPGTDNYDSSDKKRAPAWCDRILARGAGRIIQLNYRRHEVRASDHRPVSSSFKIRVKTLHAENRLESSRKVSQALEKLRDKLSTETKSKYLIETFGLTEREAYEKLMEQ